MTDSKESPYSDKLILSHVAMTHAHILITFGYGLSTVSRKDISLTYIRQMAELLTLSKSGSDLLIENGWLEEMPGTVNRYELTH